MNAIRVPRATVLKLVGLTEDQLVELDPTKQADYDLKKVVALSARRTFRPETPRADVVMFDDVYARLGIDVVALEKAFSSDLIPHEEDNDGWTWVPAQWIRTLVAEMSKDTPFANAFLAAILPPPAPRVGPTPEQAAHFKDETAPRVPLNLGAAETGDHPAIPTKIHTTMIDGVEVSYEELLERGRKKMAFRDGD